MGVCMGLIYILPVCAGVCTLPAILGAVIFVVAGQPELVISKLVVGGFEYRHGVANETEKRLDFRA